MPILFIEIESFLEILGVHIDNKLPFEACVSAILEKVYGKIRALRPLKRLVPSDVALILYKCYILRHLEYCSPLLLRINKILASKLEAPSYYVLKILLNFGNNLDWNSLWIMWNLEDMSNQFYYYIDDGPSYISDFFKVCVSHYDLRGGDCNLVQSTYNNHRFHNSFTYKITHLWKTLPTYIKQSPDLNAFYKNVESFDILNLRTSGLCNCNQS